MAATLSAAGALVTAALAGEIARHGHDDQDEPLPMISAEAGAARDGRDAAGRAAGRPRSVGAAGAASGGGRGRERRRCLRGRGRRQRRCGVGPVDAGRAGGPAGLACARVTAAGTIGASGSSAARAAATIAVHVS